MTNSKTNTKTKTKTKTKTEKMIKTKKDWRPLEAEPKG